MDGRANASQLRSHIHLIIISVLFLAVHFVNNFWTTYGFFRDELYYIACSEHPAFGYVDQPPLCSILLIISRFVFGDSVFALRIFPSLAHAVTIFLSGIITRNFGGGKYAQILCAVIVGSAPGFIGIFGIYSMNAFDILLWALTFILLFRLIETRQPRYWYFVGIVVGIGLMNKISMAWLGAGIGAGLLFSDQRYWLKSVHPYAAAGIAAILFFPYLWWNVTHDMAHLEFAANASRLKYASQNPVTFATGMLMLYNPIAAPVWIAGFITLWKQSRTKYRLFGIIIVTVLAILLINIHSKAEYFNAAAVLLIAAGSVQIEVWSRSLRFRSTGIVYLILIIVFGALLMPFAIDLLPVHTYIAYERSIGLSAPNTEGHRTMKLPQHFADRFGWKELAENISTVFHSLSHDEQKYTAIYVQNYGQAGAVDHFGKQYGLPRALSGHNNYWIWGKERLEDSVAVLIAVGGEPKDYRDVFDEVTIVLTHKTEYAMPYENDLPIYICKKPIHRIRNVWHATKKFI